jgi:hypothetical protein
MNSNNEIYWFASYSPKTPNVDSPLRESGCSLVSMHVLKSTERDDVLDFKQHIGTGNIVTCIWPRS